MNSVRLLNGPRLVPSLMRRIIYTSRSLIEGGLAELDAILAESIAWNTTAGITGMLRSDGANFAQVIEGAHDEVGTTMDCIRPIPDTLISRWFLIALYCPASSVIGRCVQTTGKRARPVPRFC
jgi:hypothetical protein